MPGFPKCCESGSCSCDAIHLCVTLSGFEDAWSGAYADIINRTHCFDVARSPAPLDTRATGSMGYQGAQIVNNGYSGCALVDNDGTLGTSGAPETTVIIRAELYCVLVDGSAVVDIYVHVRSFVSGLVLVERVHHLQYTTSGPVDCCSDFDEVSLTYQGVGDCREAEVLNPYSGCCEIIATGYGYTTPSGTVDEVICERTCGVCGAEGVPDEIEVTFSDFEGLDASDDCDCASRNATFVISYSADPNRANFYQAGCYWQGCFTGITIPTLSGGNFNCDTTAESDAETCMEIEVWIRNTGTPSSPTYEWLVWLTFWLEEYRNVSGGYERWEWQFAVSDCATTAGSSVSTYTNGEGSPYIPYSCKQTATVSLAP